MFELCLEGLHSLIAPEGDYRMGVHRPEQIRFLKRGDGRTPPTDAIRLKEASLNLTDHIRVLEISTTHNAPSTLSYGLEQTSSLLHSGSQQLLLRTLGSKRSINNLLTSLPI
jgi:hypothetical protein